MIYASLLESLSVDRSYTVVGLMLFVGLMHGRDECISQTNIEPIYYYPIGAPQHIGNTRNQHCAIYLFGTHTDSIETMEWWGSSPYR